MAYNFYFTSTAKDDIGKLDNAVKKQLLKKVQKLQTGETLLHIAKPLSSQLAGCYRIRIGDYRLICEIENQEVTVLNFKHRREVYK